MPIISPNTLPNRQLQPQDAGLLEAVASANRAFDDAYKKEIRNWIIMFSGGKDSTALLVLAVEWLRANPRKKVSLHIINSDTMVEIPTIVDQTKNFLDYIESMKNKRIIIHRVIPDIEKTFWVLMIGKGYPAPNQKFRWCTDKLKVMPSQEIIKQCVTIGKTAVFTGVRFGESDARDSRLYSSCSRGGECGQGIWIDEKKRFGAEYYAPLAFWRQCDVWDYVNLDSYIKGYPTDKIETIYNGKDTRFGCWTCTVVTRDKAMERTISSGHESFRSMMDFRNWLVQFSFDPANRVVRKNGVKGRLTLAARKKIMEKLKEAESLSGEALISTEETELILKHWDNPKYGDKYQ